MIEKPISRLVQTLEARSFTVIGCPGADGVGLEATHTFGSALTAAEGDFVVALGDIASIGRDPFYKSAAAFVDAASGEKPVYIVPGTRDGPQFEQYFGQRNGAVLSEEFTLIMLDNSGGTFSPESLAFFRDTLAITDTPSTIVAFALPPPNRFSGHSMSAEAWAKFEEAAGVWRKRVTLLIAGGVPSYFEDEIDGIRLVVTGGGGSSIRNPDRVVPAQPHVVEVRVTEEGGLEVGQKILRIAAYASRDPDMHRRMEDAFLRESKAHIDLLMDAEESECRGMPNLARLFRAAAVARLRLACNLRRVLTGRESPGDSVNRILGRIESDEAGRYERLAAAEALGDVQAAHAFRDALSSAFVHQGLFEQAKKELAGGGDIEPAGYFVCSSCGIIFSGYEPPDNCPECGAPAEFIREAL